MVGNRWLATGPESCSFTRCGLCSGPPDLLVISMPCKEWARCNATKPRDEQLLNGSIQQLLLWAFMVAEQLRNEARARRSSNPRPLLILNEQVVLEQPTEDVFEAVFDNLGIHRVRFDARCVE